MHKLLLSLIALPLAAQTFSYWPGATYDARIPTVKQVLGYETGERITAPADLVKYLQALAAAAPDRLKLFEYGETWEGRKLVYAAVGSADVIGRLPEIKASLGKLTDPAAKASEADGLIAKLPVLVWLAYGVHGNEISSCDAALLTAYHLLAAQNDPLVKNVTANALVLIDPSQNPDGRNRFVNNFEQARGLEPDASPISAEHTEPWPGGRTNHYLFDMNRDWLVATQPETQGRIKAMKEWHPQIVVDLHEMGSDGTYFFAPPSFPYNPNLTSDQRASLNIIGRNDAKWFDKFGFDYFTREVYDAFYPGYGDSWPAFHGAISMTYEQASVRGLVIRRSDDTQMQYRDSIRHHFTASLATAEAAANNRKKLLDDFYRYGVTAVEEGGKDPIQAYVLPRGRDAAATDKLAAVLVEHGVRVKRATAAFREGNREYSMGTYVVPLAQPEKRLIRTLLDPETVMEPEFLKEQERRRARKLPHQIYDVTAWSLPLLFNVEAVALSKPPKGQFQDFNGGRIQPGKVQGGKAALAYLVPWGSAAAGRFLTAAHRQDLRISSTDRGFSMGGRKFPDGTLIVKVADNPADLYERVTQLAAKTGADVFPTDTGWVEDGVNFGSHYVVHLRKPHVALAWDVPTASSAAGWTKFVLERQYGYPVTAIRTATLASADLSRFQVVILPDASGAGGYAQVLGPAGIARLKQWVADGGTLIGIADAVSFLAESRVGLLGVNQESKVSDTDAGKKAAADKPEEGAVAGKLIASELDFTKAIQADKESPDLVPGVLLRARVDPEFWLTAGMGPSVYAMFSGRNIYSPVKLDKGVNAVVFEKTDRVLGSGYLWEENRKQLANKPAVIAQPHGRGLVIAFTTDPNYRAYLDGMNVIFLNAVFRGPAHARGMVTR